MATPCSSPGDPIHAVIVGSAINHGGRTNGYTVPNPRAQAALIRDALDRAGVSAAGIGYLEAHGTGTRLGDPVEIDGLTQAFAPDAGGSGVCALGSVKSNIGHLEAAAGIAGLTKAVLQLQHGEFAPTLHAERTNPDIGFAATPFTLQTCGAPWPRPADGGPRRAGISSFGAGGANAHVIVAEYRSTTTAPATPAPSARPVLLPLSARTTEDLHARAGQLSDLLRNGAPVDLPAVAATLQTGREEMDERVCFVASTPEEWLDQLDAFLADSDSDSDPEAEGPWSRGRVRATRETWQPWRRRTNCAHSSPAGSTAATGTTWPPSGPRACRSTGPACTPVRTRPHGSTCPPTPSPDGSSGSARPAASTRQRRRWPPRPARRQPVPPTSSASCSTHWQRPCRCRSPRSSAAAPSPTTAWTPSSA
ncbi:ketoacyl-synthetase C-terminal extension domain-containing protein [Streptomyces sioyaensis]|uniref:KS-MAT linker domain-containing protein n=1 Tax=Streptomyces sioyaensis TaxID=67364 RepID=UPI0033F4CAB8